MNMNLVYLKGEHYGKYGAGDIVFARRGEGGDVVRGFFYEIDRVVRVGDESCRNDLGLKLVGCEGVYLRNTFRVNDGCKVLNLLNERGLEFSLGVVNEVGFDAFIDELEG